MKLEYITTPENAIYRSIHGYFAAGDVPTSELGMRLRLAGADIANRAPADAGARMVFEWQGNFVEGAPALNPGGDSGRDMFGNSGTLYILGDSSVFVPIGSRMILSYIDFYDTAVLKDHVLKRLKETQNPVFRFFGLDFDDDRVQRECARIKKRYASFDQKFAVIV